MTDWLAWVARANGISLVFGDALLVDVGGAWINLPMVLSSRNE